MAPSSFSVVGICCCIFCAICAIWIIYKCRTFVFNEQYQQHQAFKIRKKRVFILSGIIIVLNFLLRPILVSFLMMELISINIIWRDLMDIAQMSLYAMIEYRCWVLFYDLNYSTALVDKEWKQYLNANNSKSGDWYIKYETIFGNKTYIIIFLIVHGILCVSICGIVDRYIGFYPHRIICHFFVANIILFTIFCIRIHTQYFHIDHSYQYDMLQINKELNWIAIIMTITAFCDSIFRFILPSNDYYLIFVLYQTILITFLSIIIFYLPQRTIIYLLEIEQNNNTKNRVRKVRAEEAFIDNDIYHGLTRFMLQEFCVENLLFLSQWIQLQEIIKKSDMNVTMNTYTNSIESNLLWLTSDILVNSNNILEAARGLYDKFVTAHDVLEINISYPARLKLNAFFDQKHDDIKRIFMVNNNNDDRATTVIIDDEKNNNNNHANHENHENQTAIKHCLFVKQLNDGEIQQDIIEEMVIAFSDSIADCWRNLEDSFSRYQLTMSYKIASKHSSKIRIKSEPIAN